jgi:hypothetical protein
MDAAAIIRLAFSHMKREYRTAISLKMSGHSDNGEHFTKFDNSSDRETS